MSALGQKRTPAVQNSMSALPQKRHQMRHAIGLRAKCNARRLPRKGVGLSGRAMVKRRHLLFRFRHDLRRHWPGQEASSPVVSLSRSQRPCNLWERSLDRRCEPRGSRYAATEAGRAPLVVLVRGSRYPPSLISAALIFQRARTFSLAFSGGNRWRSQGKRVAPNRGRTIANTSNQGRVKRPISSDRVLPNGAEYQLRFALRMASQVASHKTIRSCPTITSPVKPAARTPSVKFVIA